jgi:prolyl-tRNA synthetase
MGAHVLTEQGQEVPIVMGSYGIGVERIMASAIDQHHDADGIIWPMSIAPFQVVITPVNLSDEKQSQAAARLYEGLTKAGVDVLLDDRDERPGVKFKDADLIGIPLRVTIGPKKLAQGQVEINIRWTREAKDISLDEAVETICALVKSELESLAA